MWWGENKGKQVKNKDLKEKCPHREVRIVATVGPSDEISPQKEEKDPT